MIRAIWRILRRPQPPRRVLPTSDDLLCETYLEKLARAARDGCCNNNCNQGRDCPRRR